jgi:hypothetical protein
MIGTGLEHKRNQQGSVLPSLRITPIAMTSRALPLAAELCLFRHDSPAQLSCKMLLILLNTHVGQNGAALGFAHQSIKVNNEPKNRLHILYKYWKVWI